MTGVPLESALTMRAYGEMAAVSGAHACGSIRWLERFLDYRSQRTNFLTAACGAPEGVPDNQRDQ